MFPSVLFTTAERWKQPKCPGVGEWIKKVWCTHTYCLAINNGKDILTWNVEDIMLTKEQISV